MQSENVVDLREAISHRAEPAPREIGSDDWRRYEEYMQEIFTALGMEPDTPGTRETPARFLRALYDATAGYDGDPKLLTAFPTEGRGGPDSLVSQVVEGPISFHCLCEHHALPFFGAAHVAYVAAGRDHRHLQADAARPALRPALHRAGAARRADRRLARRADRAARRRRPPRGGAPLHADARRARGELADGDDVLARRLLGRPGAAAGLPRARPALVNPLELLYEVDGLPAFDLPEELESTVRRAVRPRAAAALRELRRDARRRRRDPLRAALEPARSAATATTDRFVMGLLRACRRLRARRLGDAARLAEGALDAGAGAYPDRRPTAFAELRGGSASRRSPRSP